ncbi:Mif2/CENP-C like-domain-containing protein, partial [Mycena crocata]
MRTVFPGFHTGGSRAVSQQVPERAQSYLPPHAFETRIREASVVDFHTGAMVTKTVAFTQAMFAPTTAKTGRFLYEKIFLDGEFIEGWQIVIPPSGVKPTKSVKEGTYIFFVIEGAVEALVCGTVFVLAKGGMFMVPRGNLYDIKNIGDGDARVFFVQAHK